MGDTQIRQNADKKFSYMMAQRVEWEPWWQDLRMQFAPSRGRFIADEKAVKDTKRRNSMPRRIADEFAAGMQSGLVSPSRTWFTLSLFNKLMMTVERVKVWLNQVQEIMSGRMLQTNFYDQIVEFVKEEGIFGTAAMFIEEDDEDIFICRTLTAGQYAVDVDAKGRVNCFARRLSYTAQQLENDFGFDALPPEIQQELSQPDSNTQYEVRHLIQPNTKYVGSSPGMSGMKYQSLWWIAGKSTPDFLRESGYHEFPVIVGRWKVIGDDLYGREHPGDVAMDDARTLQDIETDARGALERAVKPPMLAPSNLLGKLDNRPNRVTIYEPMGTGGPPAVTPLFALNFDHMSAENKIEKLKADIERAFYVDLFRMWGTDLRSGRTATEVQSRESEKAYILAPITLRQTNEIVDKAILRIYAITHRAGMFPPPPPELVGQDVKLEYTSEFALLQKRAAQGGIEVVMQFAAQLAEMQVQSGKRPEVLDRLDPDEIIEQISSMHAIPAGIILGDDAVAKVREDRALEMQRAQEQQQMMESAAMAPGIAGAAKDLSQANMGDQNALEAVAAAMNGGAM